MEKEFVPYELALRMKKLGFNEPCMCRYCVVTKWEKPTGEILLQTSDCELSEINIVKAPLYQQAFGWFREIKEVEYQITYAGAKGRYNAFVEDYFYDNNGDLKEFTYEEAELACLEKLIEIIEGIES
jgi:hypothetical protein